MSHSCCRCWLTCGAVLLGLGVIAGAIAAHGLDERLETVHGSSPPVEKLAGAIPAPAKALNDFRTGVRYHVWHALGMIAVGLAGSLAGTRNWPLQAAGICFGLGIIGFSGGLYGLAVTGNSSFGLAGPAGGTLMIVGWFLLAAGTCPCGSRSTQPSQ
jgi:uncharacterized membrane protein YgdD (TMEM256/DUF423 family)